MPKSRSKSDICYNCHHKIGDYNYCPNCGQVNSHKQIPLKQILKELLGDVFTFDNKFFKSLWPLVGKPGHLTNEYISGRRVRYIFPLRLYVFTTFLFFFVLSLSNAIDTNGIEEQRKHQVTPDSLREFLKPYSNAMSKNTRERLIVDLGYTYNLEKREDIKSNPLADTLKNYIKYANPGLDDTIANMYAQQIYRSFTFHNKTTKDADPEGHGRLDQKLRSFDFSDISRSRFFSKLDSSYSYKMAVWKREKINITFAGSDTIQIGFMRELEKKAEYLFAQGDRGWNIFLNELIRQIPKVMFFLLPLFALLLKLFFIRQKIFYFNHLIFALHIHSLIFMYLIIPVFFTNGWIIAATVIAIWVHTFLATKNVYKQKLWLIFLKLNTILCLYFFILIFGFVGLSFVTVYFV